MCMITFNRQKKALSQIIRILLQVDTVLAPLCLNISSLKINIKLHVK